MVMNTDVPEQRELRFLVQYHVDNPGYMPPEHRAGVASDSITWGRNDWANPFPHQLLRLPPELLELLRPDVVAWW